MVSPLVPLARYNKPELLLLRVVGVNQCPL